MPFKSAKQRAYLFIHEPEVAKKWADAYGTKIQPKKKPAPKKPKGK